MAGRPGSGSGDGEQPEFDWLYGKNRGKQPPGDVPEPTLMLPQQPRQQPTSGAPIPPSSVPPGRGARPTPPQAAPGHLPPPPVRPRRFIRAGFWVKAILALLVLWLVYLVAVPVWTWSRVDKMDFEPDGKRPDDQPGTTYLMVGSDSRSKLTPEERKKYHTGNAESTLADTIMMLHTGAGPDVLLSFPRDWIVDGSKINGYYDPDDPSGLVKALEEQTGIRIDEYVEIGLGGVAGVVDAVGGVEICPKTRMVDRLAGLRVKKGCQEADGTTALAYSRSRHASALGDLDRVARQREVVAAIGEKVLSPWSAINPVRWWRLNQAVPDFFAFGEGTNQFDVARWAMAMAKIGDGGRTCTMPVTDGSANHMDTGRARPLFDAIIEDRTDDITKKQCTPAGLPR